MKIRKCVNLDIEIIKIINNYRKTFSNIPNFSNAVEQIINDWYEMKTEC